MSQKHLCEGWKREKLKPSTSHQQRRSMARRSCPRIGYSEADPKASCATWQAPPIEPASAACTYSNYILNLLSSNKSPSNLWHVYDVFGACTFFSPVGIAPAEVLGLALSLASAAPWWHRLVKSRIASFSADSTASAQAWGSPPKTTVIFTGQCWLTWIESYHRNVGLDVGWIALDIRETAGWSPHSSNGELSPETPYHRACRLLAPSN
jgi:hypothetical protein